MSEEQFLKDPTNLDLHREQARQGEVLKSVSDDIGSIKQVLVGDDKRSGMVVDVDQLKRSRQMMFAVLWALLTAFIGVGVTQISTLIG